VTPESAPESHNDELRQLVLRALTSGALFLVDRRSRVGRGSGKLCATSRIAKAQPVDLLLTAVIMPLMNGMELAYRMQAVNGQTKVILMSGYQTSGIAGSGRAFIQKPFSVEALGIRVRETLDRPSAFVRTRPPGAADTKKTG